MLLKKGKIVMLYVASALVIYLVGIMTAHYNLFPYPQVLKLKSVFQGKAVDERPVYLRNKVYDKETKLFNLYETKDVNIVMLGDSLTKRVDWTELMSTSIINRGMDSDITEGFLHRLEAIYKLNPKKVFLNGGTNDIYRGYSVEEIFENYKEIFQLLQKRGIKVYMQSVVFTRHLPYNKEIKKLNIRLKQYCVDNDMVYIDLNEGLAKDNMLKKEFTLDGSHLNDKGYLAWKKQIKDYI